jgi:diguanylate cyclase (GGDEF)-like protein/PAS domain S-box-containing protein
VERKSFGESKEREDRLFDALEQTITRHYMFKCDLDTNVTKWSKNAVEYFGLPGQYIYETERIWRSLVHPDDREAFSKDIEDVFSGRKKMHALEYRMKNRKGNYVVCTCKGLMTKRPDGTNESFVGMIVNHGIMDGVDAITGLHNQQEFSKFINKHVEKRDTFTIIEVGISMMNSINMIYGYSYGNDMLKRFAALLKNAVGGNGVVFRVDGAKFAICTKLYTRDKITALYRNIQDMAEAYEDESGSQIPLSVCGGVFICNRIGSDEDMIKRGVEYALERSKTDMHGELVFFEETGRQGDRERLDISSSIHKSVLNGMKGFFLCYQPIADSNTGYITGMEALLRWKSDKFGVVPPNMFIQWLELEPCFFDLGNWIIERALTDAKEIRKLRPDFMVNVNISATQLENKNFRQSVVDILEKTKYPPKYFCMELTERCKNLDIDYLREQLEFFRGLGIRIALDDFGTGNATLNLLSQLPIDELKVDMSFVKGIQDNKVNQVVVSAVMSCAHELGYASCIEGVENQDLFDYLHRYDSTYYQGYHFSKPVTLEEFKELLK